MRRTGIALLVLLIAACGPQKKGLFGDKRSAHEKYADRIKEAGLDKTSMGALWFFAANKSIAQPLSITLPYREAGYFAAEKPSAAGYVFSARRGDRLTVEVTTVPQVPSGFFVELWQYSPAQNSELIADADSTLRITHDIESDGQYLIRMQPALLQGTEYHVTIQTGPSLAFPVDESGKPKVISVWDDPRDGGVRSHEGVDIGAKFRTPAIASADGYVRNVTVNHLGGNVVFMRPAGKNYTLYYAHLDTQAVSTGDNVKAGQVLGFVGNTGNAIHTPPHLHFGIYTMGGAIDPLPFIDRYRGEPKKITADTSNLDKWLRTNSSEKVYAGASTKDSVLFEVPRGLAIQIKATADNWYKIELPDGREGFVKDNSVTGKELKTLKTISSIKLFDHPSEMAAAKTAISANTSVTAIGAFQNFYLIEYQNDLGWVKENQLQ
jgi:murein DD-endopeptidase MepM/ murein hydrolase activator NlpD/SH3-like domain-containing protein